MGIYDDYVKPALDAVKPVGDFAGRTIFSGDWWSKHGKGLLIAVPGVYAFYKMIEFFFDSMLGQDGGGMLGFIPDFFAKVSAIGFSIIAFPQLLKWSNDTALPWLAGKFGDMGNWAKGAWKKTVGGEQHSEVSPVLLGQPQKQDVAMVMPKTDVSLGAVVYEGADVVIVNTCGFLDSAREESLDAIGEALAENGKVIVTGCLGAEPEVIKAQHPSVFAITGPHQYESVMKAVHDAAPPAHDPLIDLVPPQGIRLTPRHFAYLKISEGCNNRCSFCIIPKLRGDLVSRPLDDVMREAEALAKSGVKELLVISQDTSAYGIDSKYAPVQWNGRERKTKFYDLCEALGELGVWVRLHYVYPYPHVDAAIELMNAGKILPYLDIPFQHAAPNVLKAMKRPAAQEKTLDRVKAWRKACPDLAIRSTFIVGFPGETEEDFEFLLEWMKEAQLDRVGCFKYEDVAGADSNAIAAQVPQEVKEERWHRFMATQQEISAQRLQTRVGKTVPVIIDASQGKEIIGRSIYDAPDVDGIVHLTSHKRHLPGDIVQAKITDADEYDLFAEVVK